MQTANVNLPITITGRHVSITDAMRDHAKSKVEGLHLDYPKIIEARVILNVENKRHIAEIILFCANHITIEADTMGDNMYACIDETISKIARRMRKFKTRLLKSHRPRVKGIRHIEEKVISQQISDIPEEDEANEEQEPLIIHKEEYRIRPLFSHEAIMEMELSERSFIVYEDAKTHELSVLYRRRDGDYGMIVPGADSVSDSPSESASE